MRFSSSFLWSRPFQKGGFPYCGSRFIFKNRSSTSRAAVGFYQASVYVPMVSADTMGEIMIVSKQSTYFRVPGLDGEHEIKEIRQGLGKTPDVLSVSTGGQKDQAAVGYDSSGTSVSAIGKYLYNVGVGAQLISNQNHTM